jgi:DNA replication and repair protein RecF
VFVQRVAIRAFRNLEQVEFEPSQGFNLIEGENGQGKTSLLEAVGMLASLKSFRGAKNAEMIQDGHEQARLSCLLLRDGMERDLKIEVNPRSRRILLHNKPVRQLSELYGLLNLVTFVPEDVGIVRGTPGERRLFFDRMIFASQHAYADEMADFEEALRQRNAILRQEQPSRSLARAFESELVRHGATVMLRRIA